MAKRKTPNTTQETTAPATEDNPSPTETAAAPDAPATAAAPAQPQPQELVQAPAAGPGRSWTINNRVGYRKEDSPDGRRRQIRFADRPDGQRPDDELLAPVREKKPDITYSAKDRAWQARITPEGLEALDIADQELAKIGRERTGGKGR